MSGPEMEEVAADGLAPVMAIMNTAFDPGYGEAWTEAQLRSMMTMPGTWLTLARVNGLPAGFAFNRLITDEAELLLLAVAPDHRREGVAKALIERSLELLRFRNGTRLHLEVRHNNPAIELYKKAGFSLVGRRPDYYRGIDGQVHDALTLSCSA
ncbi:MAG: GNAT family N-acetyltransferase [Pseudomonadota bacterium]